MALETRDIKHYQNMSSAERQAEALKIQQLRESPKAAVSFGSRVWTLTKTVGLGLIGAAVGSWLGNKLGKTSFGQNNVIGKVLTNNKKMIGAAAIASAGLYHMHANRQAEVNTRADLELGKISAVDAENLRQAEQSGQAVGRFSQNALAGRGGPSSGLGV